MRPSYAERLARSYRHADLTPGWHAAAVDGASCGAVERPTHAFGCAFLRARDLGRPHCTLSFESAQNEPKQAMLPKPGLQRMPEPFSDAEATGARSVERMA